MQTHDPHPNRHRSTPRGQERALRGAASAFVRSELANEGSGSSEIAETALRSLFRALPSPVARPAFAARVLASVPARRARDLAPRHRWLVALAAVCTALAAAYVLPLGVVVLGQVQWAGLLASCGAGFGHLVAGVHDLAVFGRAALALLHAVWLLLTSPQVLFSVLLATAVVGLCTRLLTELIHSPRDPAHAAF